MGDQSEVQWRHGEEAGEHRETSEKRPAFSSNRRTGSSWNKVVTSSWNSSSKDNWRARKGAGASSAGGQDGDGEFPNGSGSSLNRDGEKSRKKNSSGKRSGVKPTVHVHKGKDAFEMEGSVVTEAHPDTLYNIITDFENTARIHRTVDRVEIEDQGSEKIVKQYLRWSFLVWSGEYSVTLRMKPNPETRTVSYNLDEQGFLKIFNGSWTVEPVAIEGKPTVSKLILQQEVLPSVVPPGPLGTYTAKILSGQVKNVLTDLAIEASAVTRAES